MLRVIAALAAVVVASAADVQYEAGAVRVSGARCGDFQIRVAGSGGDAPAVSGDCRVSRDAAEFRPRYPFLPGIEYTVVLPAAAPVAFRVPDTRPEASGRVVAVYPTSSVWPENQLKFYVHFSEAMSRREAFRRIRLLDANGKPESLPFLEIDEELWDRDATRLTVLFDPGRIKRGLVPHEEAGSPLVEGRSYTLVIDREWPDASGRPMVQEFRKSFRVSEADRVPLDPVKWRIEAPPPGSRKPVVIDFGEPLDAALALRVVHVDLPGEVELQNHESRWLFTPEQPWASGRYEVRVATELEDLAGNRVGRKFDVDVFDRVETRPQTEYVRLHFEVRANRGGQ